MFEGEQTEGAAGRASKSRVVRAEMGMRMTVEMHTGDTIHPQQNGAGQGEGSDMRQRILRIALSLMARRGVDGTSMRDLASAAGLNVASLYHYFPSKRELLEAVLVEQGFMPVRAPPLDGDSDRRGIGRAEG